MANRKTPTKQTRRLRYSARRYPGLQAKVVDYVSHSINDGTLCVNVCFNDKTLFSLRFACDKAKIEPKTVQGILRHAKIQTMLDLYTQDGDETRAAQGEYLTALGVATEMVQ